MIATARRATPAISAAGLAVALAAYAARGLDGQALGAALAASGAGIALLVVDAAGWWAGAAVAGQALLAAVYLVVLVVQGRDLDTGAPAFAAGLLLAGELAVLARDWQLTGPAAILSRRLLAVGGVSLVAVAAGWILLVAAALPLPGGVLATLAGVVAAVAIPGLLLLTRPR